MATLLAKGMGASPGTETTSEDVPGMRAAAGIVTTRGGITGDAAIVARSLGKPCIASCPPMRVDYAKEQITVWRDSTGDEEDVVLNKGATITIDGSKGEIWVD